MKVLTKTQIKKLYSYWSSLKAPSSFDAKKRGYEFEAILYSLLENEGFEPLASYKPKGEQIDGSFFCLGQTFLLEAKWHKDPLPVSSIYSFKGKVDGKFHTTSGVFISISGYSNDVSDALRFGKTLNILLFDKNDMDSIILNDNSFYEVLKFKIRQAGDTGNAYIPFDIKKTVKGISKSKPIFSSSLVSHYDFPISDSGVDLGNPKDPLFLVICEGKTDEKYLSRLFEKLDFVEPVAFQFKILSGAYNLLKNVPTIINILLQQQDWELDLKGVIVILDEESEARNILTKFNEIINDTLRKSASSIDMIQILLNSKEIANLTEQEIKNSKNASIKALKNFINDRIYIEDDFERTEGENEIIKILKNIEWSKKEKSAILSGEDKIQETTHFYSLQELIRYLENEAEGAATNVVSWDSEFINTYEPPDFLDTVYDCLEEYKEEIKKIGWKLE